MKQHAKPTPQVRAGIDVGAAELVVAVQRDGLPEAPCTLPNTASGHRQLLKLLTRRGAHARVSLEATGVYSLRLALALHRAERVEVMVVNPRAIKDFQRARLCRAKTDAVDALGILEFLQRMEFVPWTPPADAVLALQQLGRRLVQLRGELTREQARRHAIAFTPDRDGLITADLAANIRHLQKRIKALQQAAAQLAAREPELHMQVQRLCSVPGIGQLSALRLLGELLVLPPELKAKQWVAHAGLDPRPRQSGTSDAPRHISRTGNRHLRLALFMPALVAIQRSPQIKATYESLLARGKKKKVALIAIMRRLLHALWGMFHHQQDFNPQLFHPLPPVASDV
jgi:transposase